METHYYYSSETCGFYPLSEVKEFPPPPDAVLITAQYHARLLAGQDRGKYITSNEQGQPILTSPPPPTAEELAASAAWHREMLLETAKTAIAPLQYAADLDMATPAEAQALTAWKKYCVLLSRVDLSDPQWPEVPGDVA